MKRTILNYIIAIISIFLITLSMVPVYTYADETETETALEGEVEERKGLGLGDLNNYKKDPQIAGAENKVQIIIGLLRIVGISISVIALIIIGIKYMLGSVEEKADYKKTLIPYLIGAFLVFTVSLLPQLIYDILVNFH